MKIIKYATVGLLTSLNERTNVCMYSLTTVTTKLTLLPAYIVWIFRVNLHQNMPTIMRIETHTMKKNKLPHKYANIVSS
jgi:hypothetical protein